MPLFVRFEEITADLGAPLVDGIGARDQYREGYFICAKEAATALRFRRGNNRSAMPVLFLYRHYLELALKDALHKSRTFDLGQSDKKFGHDLVKLWNEAEKVLGAIICIDWLAPIGPVAMLFNAIDHRADAFRYATNPDGDAQMPKNAHVVYHELIAQMDDVYAAIELAINEIRIQEAHLDQAINEAVAHDPFG
jgi:hypothetical protein